VIRPARSIPAPEAAASMRPSGEAETPAAQMTVRARTSLTWPPLAAKLIDSSVTSVTVVLGMSVTLSRLSACAALPDSFGS
jgi:hypothetical protein